MFSSNRKCRPIFPIFRLSGSILICATKNSASWQIDLIGVLINAMHSGRSGLLWDFNKIDIPIFCLNDFCWCIYIVMCNKNELCLWTKLFVYRTKVTKFFGGDKNLVRRKISPTFFCPIKKHIRKRREGGGSNSLFWYTRHLMFDYKTGCSPLVYLWFHSRPY